MKTWAFILIAAATLGYGQNSQAQRMTGMIIKMHEIYHDLKTDPLTPLKIDPAFLGTPKEACFAKSFSTLAGSLMAERFSFLGTIRSARKILKKASKELDIKLQAPIGIGYARDADGEVDKDTLIVKYIITNGKEGLSGNTYAGGFVTIPIGKDQLANCENLISDDPVKRAMAYNYIDDLGRDFGENFLDNVRTAVSEIESQQIKLAQHNEEAEKILRDNLLSPPQINIGESGSPAGEATALEVESLDAKRARVSKLLGTSKAKGKSEGKASLSSSSQK